MNRKALLYVILAAWTVPSALYATSATLQPLKGSVYVQHPLKDLWESVKAPLAVEEGDRIKTNNDSTAFLIMPDDHRVAIGPETYLVLQHMAEGEIKIYLKNGSIRNKVRHLNFELGQYYKVQTPSAVCAVRGTDFSVMQNIGTKTSQVHVFEGFVDFSALRADIAHAVTHLEAGHSATMDAGGNVQHIATPTGNPPQSQDKSLTVHHDKGNNPSNEHQGPPPPGTGGSTPSMPGGNGPTNGTEPVWYEHPDKIDPGTFEPISRLPTNAQGGTTPPLPTNQGPEPTSFNPISGTGITPGPGSDPSGNPTTSPTGNSGPPTTVTYNPPPTGSNPPPTTGTMDPTAAGNAALFDTIRSANLSNQLQGLLVAGLFQDGSVKLSPIDGQWHLYADAIQQNGANGIQFLNATQVYNQPATLNYQKVSMTFNQALPATSSAYTIATQTAFRGDVGTGAPSYYATSVDNYRSNTMDYVDVQASGGSLQLDTAGTRYNTVFASGRTTVNGTVLWNNNGGTYTYLGGSKPTLASTSGGSASAGLNNTYANGVYLGRQVTYFDPSTGQIVSAATIPSGVSAQQYFGGTYLVAQDTLYSNLFTKGPIMSFGSAQSRVLGGIDSIVNNQDALSILNGSLPVGAPDGLFHS